MSVWVKMPELTRLSTVKPKLAPFARACPVRARRPVLRFTPTHSPGEKSPLGSKVRVCPSGETLKLPGVIELQRPPHAHAPRADAGDVQGQVEGHRDRARARHVQGVGHGRDRDDVQRGQAVPALGAGRRALLQGGREGEKSTDPGELHASNSGGMLAKVDGQAAWYP